MTAQTLFHNHSSARIQVMLNVFSGALVLSLASQVTVFLPFTPVPIALAPSVALALGIVLGPFAGTAAVIIYLLEGVCGLPVFSAGRAGALVLMGPTGGYLLGYAFGAFFAGWVMQSRRMSRVRMLVAFLAGSIPLYVSGVVLLAPYVGWSRVLLTGVVPFVPGFVVKSVVLVAVIPRRLMHNRG